MGSKAIKTGLILAGVLSTGISVTLTYAQGIALEEIIVTAQRVEQNLQDVPISMTVLSQVELSNRNITIPTDLATYTPSLSVNERYGPEKSSFSIRGFNQDQSTAPTVGVYFADVVGVRAQGGTTSGNTVGAGIFTDLQNVQVLKGVQGTLFGRNTNGGAILIVPQKPTDELEGYIEGAAGNYSMTGVQGALNVPISDTVRARFSINQSQRDGYMENHSGLGPDFNDEDFIYARASIVWDVTPNLENYTIFHYSKSETNGYAARHIGCDRTSAPDGIGMIDFRGLIALSSCEQIDRQAARGDGPLDVEVNIPNPFLDLEQWQFINTTTWNVNENLTVKNILSYGEFEEKTHYQLYSDNFTIPDSVNFVNLGFPLPVSPGATYRLIELDLLPGNGNSAQETWTEELQLQGSLADGRFNFVVGGYLEFADPIDLNAGRTGLFTLCGRPQNLDCNFNVLPILGNISQSATAFKFENHGIFAQGTYDITEQLALTAGIRYTFDKIDGYDESVRVAPAPFTASPLIMTCRDSFRKPNTVVTDPAECALNIEQKSDEPTWLINLDYKPNEDTLLYAKYARGYRQGGVNFTNPGVETWEPEQVDSYELGAKMSFSGAVPGFFNIAAFYNDYTEQQVFGSLLADRINFPQVTGGAAIINAGESEISGIEIETSVLFFDSLRIDLSYAWLDTELKSLDASGINLAGTPFLAVIPRAEAGGVLNLVPDHKLTVSATYLVPIDESWGDLSIGVTYTHVDEQQVDIFQPPPTDVIDARDLVNLNINWKRLGGSGFDLALFGTNLTDEEYPVATGAGFASFGIADYLYGKPRMYGARVRYNFGG